MNMMLIFDVLVALLGAVIVVQAVSMRREGQIPGLFVPPEEMRSCKDRQGFLVFLFPRAMAFGIVCILFGAQGLVNDLAFPMGWGVNLVTVILFVAVWVWFSMQLRRGRKEFW